MSLGLFFLITLLLAANQVSALDAGEVSALKDMQAEWGTQLGWTGSPSCSWNGVTCDPEGNVIGLYVLFQLHEATNPHQNSLSQPKLLYFCVFLFRFLSSNHLSGTIPSSIGNFVQLYSLYVHACFQFCQQSHLKTYSFNPNFYFICVLFRWLYDNQLSGTIPSSIGNLAKLQNLHVHSCFQFH